MLASAAGGTAAVAVTEGAERAARGQRREQEASHHPAVFRRNCFCFPLPIGPPGGSVRTQPLWAYLGPG